MSEPNRYHLWAAFECHGFSKAEAVLRFSAEEDGMWVQWQDYARLKAENERLRASSFVTAVPVEEYEKLQAEVERLRKAGDAMFDCVETLRRGRHGQAIDNAGGFRVCLAWLAANENFLQ